MGCKCDINGKEIFVSARSRSANGSFTGLLVRSNMKTPFSRLTPNLLSNIPNDALSAALADKLILNQNCRYRVHEAVLREGLSELRGDTEVIEISVGPDFRRLTPQITRFSELVSIMEQANDTQLASGLPNDFLSRKGVRVLLGGQENPDCRCIGRKFPCKYWENLGLFFVIDRLHVSKEDYLIAWVPLNITIEGFRSL